MTVAEKVDTLASTIRAEARDRGLNPWTLTDDQITGIADDYARQNPNTTAGQYYIDCTDHQWQRVVRMTTNSRRTR
jgi:hypothetical protein